MTPQTAFQTHVALTHLRWLTAARAPELFGRTQAMKAPEPRKPDYEVAIRHFKVEFREDGMSRMVSYVADRESGGVVMDYAGEWKPPVVPIELSRIGLAPTARRAAGDDDED